MNNAESEWQTYRSKFLIQAKQLTRALVFVDALGREHRGKKGDYLVESANGAQRIWPCQLFEDAYVLLDCAGFPPLTSSAEQPRKGVSAPQSPEKTGCRETEESLAGKPRPRPAPRTLIA